MNHSKTLTAPCSMRLAAAYPTENNGRPDRAASAGHILLVDNDSVIRGSIASLLRGAGYRVDTARDGGAGLIALCFNPYDLLITEHDMPRLTGLDLLRRMRACPLLLPAIMISGFIPWEEADLLRLLRPGAAMEMPFSFASLLAKIRMLLPGRPESLAAASVDRPSHTNRTAQTVPSGRHSASGAS
jgi:DNA-binding response OmpR family regulator